MTIAKNTYLRMRCRERENLDPTMPLRVLMIDEGDNTVRQAAPNGQRGVRFWVLQSELFEILVLEKYLHQG